MLFHRTSNPSPRVVRAVTCHGDHDRRTNCHLQDTGICYRTVPFPGRKLTLVDWGRNHIVFLEIEVESIE